MTVKTRKRCSRALAMQVRRDYHPTKFGVKALCDHTGLSHRTIVKILDGQKFGHPDMQT